jgi:serine phosphatase RsbU (regulator of sigma subunit)
MSDAAPSVNGSSRRQRADAAQSIERLLEATAKVIRDDPDARIDAIAKEAGVSRATLYRHFESRGDLIAAARQRSRELSEANEVDGLRPPGELAGGPTPLDVADVLNKVPPHLLGDQIVAEAQRLAGVTSVALYLVDIDGTNLLRLAGSEEFPELLAAPLAVGPELPREGLLSLEQLVADELPGTVVSPLFLRGRAIGVLLATDAPSEPLQELARQAAASLALANSYTDVFDATRRRRETSAASEIQQNLLPPRVARIAGGMMAGNVLPGYDVGGDWFDYVENRDGAWIGVADSVGRGTRAAALGAVSLGAFRAKRRVNARLEEVAVAIDVTMRELEISEAFVNAILARWHGPSSTFTWIACGSQSPVLLQADGGLLSLDETQYSSLGRGPIQRDFRASRRRLLPDERLLLLSDGVLERRKTDGTVFGLDGIRSALSETAQGAAATVRAIEDAITAASAEPLEDDATVVVFAPTGS